jgi:hypothetical protein
VVLQQGNLLVVLGFVSTTPKVVVVVVVVGGGSRVGGECLRI